MLEVDLLLGKWAVQNVMQMSDAELGEYEAILDLETNDLLNILTGKVKPPAEYNTAMLERLMKECRKTFGRVD